jgi:hypothetical protein
VTDRAQALEVLQPVLKVVAGIDPADPMAADKLNAALPLDGETMRAVAARIVDGVQNGSLVPREAGGVRFGRVAKPTELSHGLSIDVVDMDGPGPGHRHPNGEIDLSFVLDGSPTFDGQAPGWLVMAPDSWHVPTVAGGRMAIVYFLPDGAIEFGPRPA